MELKAERFEQMELTAQYLLFLGMVMLLTSSVFSRSILNCSRSC